MRGPGVGLVYSDVASGWAGLALANPEFGSSVNPFTTRGADYAHLITASPPGFENPAASLCIHLLIHYRGRDEKIITEVKKYIFLSTQNKLLDVNKTGNGQKFELSMYQ